MLGPRPYADVPAYMQGLDVGLIPFRAHDPFVQGINPNKVYQYLAAGLPVLTTPLLAAPGGLDSTFGTGGKVTTAIGTAFAGTVTFKNAQNLRAALALLPQELILVETDAPFLTPMPYRGQPNASYLIPHTMRHMAEVRGAPLDRLCAAVSDNANRVFGSFA